MKTYNVFIGKDCYKVKAESIDQAFAWAQNVTVHMDNVKIDISEQEEWPMWKFVVWYGSLIAIMIFAAILAGVYNV